MAGHQQQRQRVAERPAQLGHVVEVHAVDPGDRRRDRRDRHPGRDPPHVRVLLHADLGQVGVQDRAEQVVEAVAPARRPGPRGRRRRGRTGAAARGPAAPSPVDEPGHRLHQRPHRPAELDDLALEVVDARRVVGALGGEDPLLDLLDVLLDRVARSRCSRRRPRRSRRTARRTARSRAARAAISSRRRMSASARPLPCRTDTMNESPRKSITSPRSTCWVSSS